MQSVIGGDFLSCQLENVHLMTLLESKLVSGKSGVLGTFKAVFAEIDMPNRNGRVYSRDVWEKAISSDSVKERIGSKTFFGELNHPDEEDYSEIVLDRVSHNVTSLQISGNQVIGEADILDTPSGRLLASFIRYGSNLGISSRAVGMLESAGSQGLMYVTSESFLLYAFDIVVMPSVLSARIENYQLTEGVKLEKALREFVSSNAESRKCMVLAESFTSKLRDEGIDISLSRELGKAEGGRAEVESLDGLREEVLFLREALRRASGTMSDGKEVNKDKPVGESFLSKKYKKVLNLLESQMGIREREVKDLKSQVEVISDDLVKLSNQKERAESRYTSLAESRKREVDQLRTQLDSESKNRKMEEEKRKCFEKEVREYFKGRIEVMGGSDEDLNSLSESFSLSDYITVENRVRSKKLKVSHVSEGVLFSGEQVDEDDVGSAVKEVLNFLRG